MSNRELLDTIEMLRGKIDAGKLIIFVGAGVSKNVTGMPDWYQLIKAMADKIGYSRCTSCRNKTDNCTKDCKFQDAYTQDEYLKIPQYVYNADPDLYDQLLKENISDAEYDVPLSNVIFSLNPAHIITTNFDKLIESSSHPARANYEVIIRDSDLLKATKRKYIIKMHGDIAPENRKDIVLKESDFLEFSQRHVLIELFVKALLADHTILFLGYSMNDYNIKLIISWLNYIRVQNKDVLGADDRIGFIVQDTEELSARDVAYFANNYISIVNLRKMPQISDVPESISSDIGKRLYSFLSVLNDEALEEVLGKTLIYDKAVTYMDQFRYMDFNAIAGLLHLKKSSYFVEYGKVTFLKAEEYAALVQYLKTDSQPSKKLASFLVRAGIHCFELIDSMGKHEDTKFVLSDSSCANELATPFYQMYLCNRYSDLNDLLGMVDTPEEFFYGIQVNGYTQEMHDAFEHTTWPSDNAIDRIAYLYNKSSWKAFRSWSADERVITACFDSTPSQSMQCALKLLRELLVDNAGLQRRLNALLEDHMKNYDVNTRVIGSSLGHLLKIKAYAYDAYKLFFSNHIVFNRCSDLTGIIEPYVKAMLISNGSNVDFQQEEHEFMAHLSQKERYHLNPVDIDMITKMIKPKQLTAMLDDYQVKKIMIAEPFVDHIMDGFINLSKSMLTLEAYGERSLPMIFINYCILLLRIDLSVSQKEQVSLIIDELVSDPKFIESFFSIHFFEWRLYLKVFHDLVECVGAKPNLDFLSTLFKQEKFGEYYVNTSSNVLGSLLCSFTDTSSPTSHSKMGAMLRTLPDQDRIRALRLLRRVITDDLLLDESKAFIQAHYDQLSRQERLDFVLTSWVILTAEHKAQIISNVLATAKSRIPGHYVYPDPLDSQLESVYLLYITGCLEDLSALKELANEKPILHFLLDDKSFDYSQVDLSNYMWQNIARRSAFMQRFVEHKDIIAPQIEQRIAQGTASEFERKVLYGYLLSDASIELC